MAASVLDQDRARIIGEIIANRAADVLDHREIELLAEELIEAMPDRPTGKTLKSEADAVQRYIDLDAAALRARRAYTTRVKDAQDNGEDAYVGPDKTTSDLYALWQRAEDARHHYMTLLGVSA